MRKDDEAGEEAGSIDVSRNRFPFCVVWQPFPPLTWIVPMIGHTGITDSRGIVWDFQGPYTIVSDRMMLGRATRYLQLDPKKVFTEIEGVTRASELWDRCVEKGNDDFSRKIHCLIYPNCNHHVAHCLNVMRYGGWSHFEMFQLWFLIFFKAKFCGTRGLIMSLGPFVIVLLGIMAYLIAR